MICWMRVSSPITGPRLLGRSTSSRTPLLHIALIRCADSASALRRSTCEAPAPAASGHSPRRSAQDRPRGPRGRAR
eukprot:9284128-Pyramimonas_sp.AAC.1